MLGKHVVNTSVVVVAVTVVVVIFWPVKIISL